MPLRHALILAINTSLLTVLFTFTAWLYRDARANVHKTVDSSLVRAAAITGHLARLREVELSGLAMNLASSPMLQGALATADRETIEDVLSSLVSKNTLAWAGLAREDVLRHASAPPLQGQDLSVLGAGHFLGKAATARSGFTLILAEKPTPSLLDAWSEITAVSYAVHGPAKSDPIHNLPPVDAALLAQRPDPAGTSVRSAAGVYYARRATVQENRFDIDIFAPREEFWSDFKTRRNSLVVLGGILFFAGLCLSILFAGLIERHALAEGASASEDWRRLLSEIEAARAGRPKT